MNKNTHFLIKLLVVTVVLISAIFSLNTFNVIVLPPVLYYVVIVFATITYLGHTHLTKVKPRRFVNAFMGVMGIKFFSVLMFITVYLFIDKTYKYEVAFGVFAIYMVFNILLLSVIKHISTKENELDKTA